MLRHRLAALFEPHTVLIVSDRPLALAKEPPRWLRHSLTLVDISGSAEVMVPDTLCGVAPGARPDLALLCVDPSRLAEVLRHLEPQRPRSLAILPHEQHSEAPAADVELCRVWGLQHDCAVLGPRSFGLQRPHLGLNCSHQPHTALGGRVALVTQSRSITAAVLDWAQDIELGFSAIVSLGDEAGVDVADVLDYLSMDSRTDSIALYLEETTSSRRFTSALRAAAGVKPVVVLKVGRSSRAESAEDIVFDALLRRVGAVRIRYFVQLFSALKVLVYTRRPRGRRIALFSNGKGASQLALDVMGDDESVARADLSQASIKALSELLEPGSEVRNPVVTYARLDADRVQQVMSILTADPGVDGVLALLCPDPLSDVEAAARQLAQMAPDARKPIITCFLGDASMRPLRHILDSVGTPAFRTPESAANAFGILGAYHYNQVLSQQTLPPEPLDKLPRLDEARGIIEAAQNDSRRALTPGECAEIFDCFHMPVRYVPGHVIVDDTPEDPYDDPLPMAISVSRDPKLGPYIVFGSGAQDALLSVEHRAVELPPLNSYLARKLVQRSSLWHRALLRQITPAAFDSLIETLERVSQMVSELPGIESVMIDPLYATDDSLLVSSVRMELVGGSPLVLPETTRYEHMAIHPYPRRMVQAKVFKDGQPWMLRPIRPEDAEPLQEFVRGLSDKSRYMRFVSMLRELTPRMLARYTRIDYDRELALVATVHVPNPEHRGHPRELIIGFAHYLRNPDGRGAEYALVIGDEWQRRGLGAQLMRGLIDAAKEQGLTYIDGLVLAANRPMLSLMMHLGFQNDPDQDDPTMRRVWLDLGETRGH